MREKLSGMFSSTYTITEGSDETTYHDVITFRGADDVAEKVVGEGRTEGDGMKMLLELDDNGTELSGSWRELNPDGEVAYQGLVKFTRHEQSRLEGTWWSGDSSAPTEQGTWQLTRLEGE